MPKPKLIIHQPKRRFSKKGGYCKDPFFYDGMVAQMGKFYFAAVGDIRIYCGKHQDLCYDSKPRNCCCLKEPTSDKDITFGMDEDQPFWFANNNWFEFLGLDQDDDPMIDVCFDYDEAIATLKWLNSDEYDN